ncbi:unnamed protein product [Miscanthus lutarioriparius]|uniref:RING-type E3 ubiquitin transferase n=1 Tax=Miscanthus lutarioriparius TaxID=422564 RepID=A0A811PMI4_9POAL|nr:unnamed protein product [Miscanthus lutarioriparius]
MANDSLAHHLLLPLAGGCWSDVDEEEEEPGNVSFPSFWPPFPGLSSDSDSDAASFVRPRMDRPRETAASSFFGLGFHDGDDDEWAPPDEDGELALPLCWDCLQLEDHDDDHRRWDVGVSDADEWEQVAGREEEEEAAAASAVRILEWEVLLAANSLGSLAVDDGDGDDDLDAGIETYFLDDADDLLFGHLAAADADHEPPGKCGRPAAKAAVEALPTVVVAEADAARGDAQCAVCKDGVEAGERARRLPCAHLYHDGCILPWLAIRNTCPLCRHELPTDDPEYEKWKARRAAGDGGDADRRGTAAGMMSSSGYLDEWVGEGATD